MGKSVQVTAIVATLGSVTGYAAQYIVHKQETLSGIAQKTVGGPLWGKKGSLQQLVRLNPQIQNPDLIFPGQIINLPGAQNKIAQIKTSRAPSSTDAIIEPTRERYSNAPINPELPLQSESNVKEPVFESFGIFSTEIGFLSSRFDSTERDNSAKATLLGKNTTAEEFNYTQVWSNDFRTSVYIGIESINLNPPQSGGTLNDNHLTFHDFGFMAKLNADSAFSIGVALGMAELPVLTGVSSSAIGISTLYTPRLTLLPDVRLIKNGKLSLGILGSLGVSAPTSGEFYHSEWDPDFGLQLYLKQQAFSWMSLETGVRANYENQNTSITSQSQTDLGVYLKLNFPLGGRFN